MLYQVTTKEAENLYSQNRAEGASVEAVKLYYMLTSPKSEIINIGAPTDSPKPGQPLIFCDLPIIKNIYRLMNGQILLFFVDGQELTLYASRRVEDVEILKAIEAGDIPATEAAKKTAFYTRCDLERDETNAKEERENRETCKRIADELDEIAAGDLCRCPHCGEYHSRDTFEDSEHENDDGETCYTCPDCGAEIEEDDLDPVTMWDYFEDNLGIEYTIDYNKEYKSCEICVAWGGPSIYVDTGRKAVMLYWWGSSAQYGLLSDTVDAIDEYAEELFNC